jgi:hypothetical protein
MVSTLDIAAGLRVFPSDRGTILLELTELVR